MLNRIDEGILFVAAFLNFLFVAEIAFRLARRHQTPGDDGARVHFSGLQNGLLALVALLLSFNFSIATARFDGRKALVQDEVNSIGTAYLRGDFLPRPQREEFKGLLREYVAARVAFGSAVDAAQIDAAHAEATRLQGRLWEVLRTTVAEGPTGWQTSLLIQSMNEMDNTRWKRFAVLDNRVPELVLHLLFAVATGAMGLIGYGYGLTGRRRFASTAIFALLIALVMLVILDLDRPRSGIIRIGEEGMLRIQKAIQTPQ